MLGLELCLCSSTINIITILIYQIGSFFIVTSNYCFYSGQWVLDTWVLEVSWILPLKTHFMNDSVTHYIISIYMYIEQRLSTFLIEFITLSEKIFEKLCYVATFFQPQGKSNTNVIFFRKCTNIFSIEILQLF